MKTLKISSYLLLSVPIIILALLAGCSLPAATQGSAEAANPTSVAAAGLQFNLTADVLPVSVTRGSDPAITLAQGQSIPIAPNDKISVGEGGLGKLLYSDRIAVEILQETEIVLGGITNVAGNRIEATIIQDFGHTHITIGDDARASLILKTNDSTITSLTDGTEFSVCYAPGADGLTCHPVLKGSIKVFGLTGSPQVYTAPPSVGAYTFNGQAPQPPVCFHEQEYKDWLSQMRSGAKIEEIGVLGALVAKWYNEPCPAEAAAPMPMETPTEMAMPSGTQGAAYFTEEFDSPNNLNSWPGFQWNNTAPGSNLLRDEKVPMIQDGYLVFDIGKPNVSAFAIYDLGTYGNVKISLSAHNSGQNSSSVSLICRYSSDGWYEFQIGNNGLFNIQGYMSVEKQYYNLYSGGSTLIHSGMGVNEYTATCVDNNLTLYINGKEAATVMDMMHQLGDGKVGLAVSSNTLYPILEQINWFKAEQP